ncbi:cyclic GMP-AMP synthase-like receptor isoform X2 [Phlebotomus papatasi]|uniref:cyclic GMP-AMP synthase-like receptor isoform X2 n=1 Tax=Phlebotomus papatasi TaxID=29031 RepID=UPI0024833A55|nr:cyclic GMP-AMP synthase-like receptor isoform X2 [Phlebotomus papatasi]
MSSLTDFNTMFHDLNRFITLQSGKLSDRKKYMGHFTIIMNAICNDLKERSELFKRMYHGIDYSGSYRDNLKVGKPNEYDINIKMKFVKPDKVIVGSAKPGYLKINITELLEEMKMLTGYDRAVKELTKLINSEGLLLQNKWMAWSEGIITSTFAKVKQDLSAEYNMSHSKQGPAHTIKVASITDYTVTFSIDFVFGIMLDLTKWIATRPIPESIKTEDNYFTAIPKPNKTLIGQPNPLWIASYPAQDHNIMHDKNRLKDSIRFLKKIRDTQGIENLKSFYIKTVVMLETDKRPSLYWQNPIRTVLIDMLTAVINRLENGNIPSYWNKNFNIIGGFSQDQKNDMVRKLKKVKGVWENSLDKQTIISTILPLSETQILMDTMGLETETGGPRRVFSHQFNNEGVIQGDPEQSTSNLQVLMELLQSLKGTASCLVVLLYSCQY